MSRQFIRSVPQLLAHIARRSESKTLAACLTEQQNSFARSLVEGGRYSSMSSVFQHGLEPLRQKTETVETAALRELVQRRLNGPMISATEMEIRVAGMIERRDGLFVWTLEYSEDAERDFELIFDHVFDAYVELGEAPDEAVERTAERVNRLRVEIDRLVDTPCIPDILAGILRA